MLHINRHIQNPLVSPADIPVTAEHEVIGTFNPAACVFDDEVLLLVRVAKKPVNHDPTTLAASIYQPDTDQYETVKFDKDKVDGRDPRIILQDGKLFLTSVSEFYLARIKSDGSIAIDPEPFMRPATSYEAHGIEDPRITKIGDTYYIIYTACSAHGLAVALASTQDWVHVQRLGIILPPNNKDCVLFPEKIDGKYYLIHRPSPDGVPKPEIWISSSPDLLSWGDHHVLLTPEEGWESDRIGAGAPPIRTEDGWLLLYHGADDNMDYCLGAALLDLDDPTQVLWRSQQALMKPEAEYETSGFFSGVVFVTGAVQRGDELDLYYGASDTLSCGATVRIEEILEMARSESRNEIEQDGQA